MKKNKIGVESCPKSNKFMGFIAEYAELGIPSFLKEGILVSVNSDDPAMFGYTLTDTLYELALEENLIIGQKNVTMNEQFFQGHFPVAPIMPGVLILEALAQTGGILVHQKGYGHKIALLLNISNAKFRKPVTPGDVLMLEARGLHLSGKGGKVAARALVNDQVAVEAEISFVLLDRPA